MSIADADGIRSVRFSVDRRSILALGGAAIAAAAAGMSFAAPSRAEAGAVAGRYFGASSQHEALVDAALTCVSAGEACVSAMSRARRDSVLAMMTICAALGREDQFDARRFTDLVRRAQIVCADCAAAVSTDLGKAECETCARACTAFVTQSRTLV